MILKARNIVIKIPCSYAHTEAASQNKNKLYSSTVLLPHTKLPLRLEGTKLTERDAKFPDATHLYNWQRMACLDPEYILHDGPPYANGPLHMGHAINKILKDAILRSKIIRGQKVNYIPGWDCHGLPIELKAISNATQLAPVEIRQKARNFAKQTIEKQKKMFQSWGIIGEWENSYKTFNNSYIKNQMKRFADLYEKKLVYRDVKPVHWSPSSRTALAEAELVYNDKHASTAIILQFKINYLPEAILREKNVNVYALVWTTTPWTLPSNQAICFNPKLSYSLVASSGKSGYFLVASNLIESLSKTFNTSINVINTFSGKLLHNVTYHHPINSEEILPFLEGVHATDSKGTGLVHTAPAHGVDDFLVALKNKLSIVNLVDGQGCYMPGAGSKLSGLFVLTKGTTAVLEVLKQNIVHSENYVHSYPYDWRTNQPVIVLASKQWFIDTDAIKTRAIEMLKDVQIIPKSRSLIYKHNLRNQLEKRPYWCISRQRSWGTPIPVFYDMTTQRPIINKQIIDHLTSLLDKYGSDYWWTLPLDELLPKHLQGDHSIDNIEKGKDIFDIWVDSGLSWSSVLGDEKIADMYLEGTDQFTGWFQASLITSVALQNKAPYKSLYVHGFAVDEHGCKMSKSQGNVVDPFAVVNGKKGSKAYGIDTLRWWVVCHANSDAMAPISTNVLQASADEVQKIRSVLRFALGAVFDYKMEQINYSELLMIDKYLLHLLWNFYAQGTELSKTFEFNKLAICVLNFLTNPVSALYYVAIKDRLYCNTANDSQRKAAQYVLRGILEIVIRSIAPVVPHLAEEFHQHMPQTQGSLFQNASVAANEEWCNLKVHCLFNETFINIKKDLHKNAGANTLDLDVEIVVSEELINNIQEIQSDLIMVNNELMDILQVSKLELVCDKQLRNKDYVIKTKKSNLHTCLRCRRFCSDMEGELCLRCKSVVDEIDNKSVLSAYIVVLIMQTYQY